MRRQSLRSKTALVVVLVVPSPAFAQVVDLPQILISAHQVPFDAAKVGSSVTVITGEEMQARGIANVADALRFVPGVTVQPSGNGGSLMQIRIRGSESNEALVLIDGVPAMRLEEGDFDWADFLADDVERIEVIRGPQSGIHGANAQSGVISIVTKSGKGLARPEAIVRVEGGMQQTHRESLTVRGAHGAAYGSATVQYRATDGHNISRFGSEKDGHKALILTGKGGIDLTPQLNIEGSVRHVDREVQYDPEFAIPLPDGLGFDTYRSTQGRIAATHTAFDGRLVQRLGASRVSQHYVSEIGFGPFIADSSANIYDYKASLRSDTNLFGGEKHFTSFVADHTDESYRNNFGADESRRRHGIAGEHVVDFASGLTLSGAVRRDFNTAFADVTTWRLTAAQRMAQYGTRLHASVGKGVTNPTFSQQFGNFFPGFVPNPNLMPENSLGWDAGIEQSWFGGMFVTDVTYFSADFRNKIELMGNTVINVAGVSPRRGVEVSAKWTPHELLLVDATYTYTDSKLANGLVAIRRPRHAASANVTAYSPDRRGRFGVGVVYNGEREDGDTFNIPGRVHLPGYTLVSATASYELKPGTTVYVRAENLLNTSYEDIFSYRSPGFTAYAGLRVKLGGE